MHVTVTILTKAESARDAAGNVSGYLDGLATWFDYFRTEHPRPLAEAEKDKPMRGVQARAMLAAEQYVRSAGEYLEKGSRPSAGMCYMRAARIMCEELSDDIPLFNMESEDYSVPNKTDGWWAVDTDFHL